jgi:hypothetical protein
MARADPQLQSAGRDANRGGVKASQVSDLSLRGTPQEAIQASTWNVLDCLASLPMTPSTASPAMPQARSSTDLARDGPFDKQGGFERRAIAAEAADDLHTERQAVVVT